MSGNRFLGLETDRLVELFDEADELPAFAWPGGYDIAYLTVGGDDLCGACATETVKKNIEYATTEPGYRPIGDDRIAGYSVGPSDDGAHCVECNRSLDA